LENEFPAHYPGGALAGMENMYDPHRTSIPSGHLPPHSVNHGGSMHSSYPPYSTSNSMAGVGTNPTQDSQLKRDKDSIYG